jgi:hypothetical protein
MPPRAKTGKVSFSVTDVAELLIIRSLVRRGLSPYEAVYFASSAKSHVAFWAFSEPGALVEKTAEVGTRLKQIVDYKASNFASLFVSFRDGQPHRYVVIWPPNFEIHWATLTDDLNEVMESGEGHSIPAVSDNKWDQVPFTSGAIILLDLKALGKTLAQRAGGPLGHIEMVEGAA